MKRGSELAICEGCLVIMSSPAAVATKTGITPRASLSRILASRRGRKMKPSEYEPKIAVWKIVRGDKAPAPAAYIPSST